MKKFVAILAVSLAGALPAVSQSLEDLNIQIHGYATQGFLYTTNNNIFTTESSNGSPAWTEAVVNVGAQPIPKLRIGVQARYFLLGNFGNAITLDWAAADYKANDKFGVRFGKVKIPTGLFNETQDIDPSYMWSLLPQSIYPISSRNSVLAEYGGVVYGTLKLGTQLGKLEYRGWSGEEVIGEDDGYWVTQREEGLNLPNGLGGISSGAALHWKTPVTGLMAGVSASHSNDWHAVITAGGGALSGTESLKATYTPSFFAKYEKDKVMVAGEYSKVSGSGDITFTGLPNDPFVYDIHPWYGMASYKVTGKLSAGVYQGQYVSKTGALGPAKYSKDWTVSGRYDFNEFLYAKAEQHFIKGTAEGYDITLNPNGLQPNTKMTILKMGVSF
jgi:hypothetical protein